MLDDFSGRIVLQAVGAGDSPRTSTRGAKERLDSRHQGRTSATPRRQQDTQTQRDVDR